MRRDLIDLKELIECKKPPKIIGTKTAVIRGQRVTVTVYEPRAASGAMTFYDHRMHMTNDYCGDGNILVGREYLNLMARGGYVPRERRYRLNYERARR